MPIKTGLKPIMPSWISEASTPITEAKNTLKITAKAEKIPRRGWIS